MNANTDITTKRLNDKNRKVMTFDKYIEEFVRKSRKKYARLVKVASYFGEIYEDTYYDYTNFAGEDFICISVESPKYEKINVELQTNKWLSEEFYDIRIISANRDIDLRNIDSHGASYHTDDSGDIYVYDYRYGRCVPIGEEEMNCADYCRLIEEWKELYDKSHNNTDDEGYEDICVPITHDRIVGVSLKSYGATFHIKDDPYSHDFNKFSVALNDALLEKVKNIILNK